MAFIDIFPPLSVDVLMQALFIFCMRITDVSIGTLRINVLVRGYRGLAGILSFVESILWLTATAQVITNLDSPINVIAFASGYAVGSMLGTSLTRWLAIGKSMMRIITATNSPQVADALRAKGFFVTVVNAEGRDGEVRIAFSVIPKKRQKHVLATVRDINPAAFVTFEDINTVSLSGGHTPFSTAIPGVRPNAHSPLRMLRNIMPR